MKTTKEDFDFLSEHLTEKNIRNVLENSLEKIKILESLYMTWSNFDEEFKDICYARRQEECKISSFIYDFARKNYWVEL